MGQGLSTKIRISNFEITWGIDRSDFPARIASMSSSRYFRIETLNDPHSRQIHFLFVVCFWLLALSPVPALAQNASGFPGGLEEKLLKEEPAALAQEARQRGDPARGAVVFFQPGLTCVKCHASQGKEPMIGPDLTRLVQKPGAVDLIDSVLRPSKTITKGYESITIVTKRGTNLIGLLAEERPDRLILRDPTKEFAPITVSKTDIEERSTSPVSIMPAGLVNQLGTRQQFLDLVRYLMEITEKGRLVPASSSRTRRFSSLLRCRNTKRTSIMPASSK